MCKMMNPHNILTEKEEMGKELYMNIATGTIQPLEDWHADFLSDQTAHDHGQEWEDWSGTLRVIDSLYALTGQESGIIIFHESGEAIALNWSSYQGIPRVLLGSAIIGMGLIPPIDDNFRASAHATRSRLESVSLIWDETGGDCLEPGESTIWNIVDEIGAVTITVIAPLGWN